jgi:putative FmdB family regulatory protein
MGWHSKSQNASLLFRSGSEPIETQKGGEKTTMPTYDYECSACNHTFEEFQSMTAEPLKKCPQCGKPKLRRLFGTGAAVIFKGSGFYQTDYRSESYKKGAKADEAAKPSASGNSGTNGTSGTGGTGTNKATGESASAGKNSKSGD